MADFNTLMSKPMDEIERPKPLPAGTYTGIIVSHEFGKSSQKQTDFVRFMIRVIAPGEDVDPEALKEYGQLGEKSLLRHDFYITEDAVFRLKEFLSDTLGIRADSINAGLPQTTGMQVGVIVKHEMSQKDPSVVFATIDRCFKQE